MTPTIDPSECRFDPQFLSWQALTPEQRQEIFLEAPGCASHDDLSPLLWSFDTRSKEERTNDKGTVNQWYGFDSTTGDLVRPPSRRREISWGQIEARGKLLEQPSIPVVISADAARLIAQALNNESDRLYKVESKMVGSIYSHLTLKDADQTKELAEVYDKLFQEWQERNPL